MYSRKQYILIVVIIKIIIITVKTRDSNDTDTKKKQHTREAGVGQAGFTLGRLYRSYLHSAATDTKENMKNREVHLAFIGLKKAYD